MSSFFWNKVLVRSGAVRWIPKFKRLFRGGEQSFYYLSHRALALPIDDLIDPALFPDVQAPDAINLALGSPRCELPLGAPRGLHELRGPSPWGQTDLRRLIAERSSTSGGLYDPEEETLITHGATGAFGAVIDTFIDPGSPVILFDPTSPIFVLGLKHRRARLRWIKTWLEEGKTRFDLQAFASAMRGAKMLVLADPANPTGGVLASEDLEQIAWWAQKHDVLIYRDESFGQFRYDPTPTTNLGAMPHAATRLLTANGVSKTYGLSSARVGWLLGPKHLMRPTMLVASMNAPFVSPLGQQAALTALRTGEALATNLRDEMAGRRRYLFESLQGMGFKPAFPTGGYFFWVPVNHLGLSGREFARRLLLERSVLVNPGEPFGPCGQDHIRLSYATDEGRLREGVQRLTEFMTPLKPPCPVEAMNPIASELPAVVESQR